MAYANNAMAEPTDETEGAAIDKTENEPGEKPARKLSAEDQAKLVEEVRDNVETHYEHERLNIIEATIDQRFRANDHWPAEARREREAAGRPVLTFNRTNTFVNQVVNPIRQADKAIKARIDDEETDPTLAKVVDGLLRKIQRQSMSESVYGHALDCQAGCGIGWVRVCNDYRTDTSFDQDIFIEKIDNPLSVGWDPAARDPVRSDAMWGFVSEMIPLNTFRARWPDAAEESADNPTPADVSDTGLSWNTGNDIRIVEYYKKVPTKRTIAKLQNGKTKDITDMPPEQAAMLPVQQTRQVDTYRVEKYMVSGTEVLEGPSDVPGCYIPLVPALGGEVALDNGIYRYSVIRFARDANLMYNLTRSSMAEWIGQSPKSPYLGTQKMFANHRSQWDTLNTQNRNYLTYTPDEKAPGMRPERVQPAQIPTGLVNEAQFAVEDMKSGANVHNASLGASSNETSGVAIDSRKAQDDVSNYHFSLNFQATLMHIGCIIMSWIPIVYDTPRTVILVGEDGTEHPTPINTPQQDPQTGQWVIVNDLTDIKFAVDVTIGPSFSSRRIEDAAQIGEFMKTIPPEQAATITDIYARNMTWDGHEEIAKRLKATIPPQIIQATMEGPDGQPLPPQPQEPNPLEIAQLKKIVAEIEEIQASTEAKKATAALTVVQAKQLDRQDAVMDFPGNVPSTQRPTPQQSSTLKRPAPQQSTTLPRPNFAQ